MKKKIFVFFSILLFIIVVNIILSLIIKQKLTDFLLQNESDHYTTTVQDVTFKLVRRTLTFTDVLMIPKKESIDSIKNNSSSIESLEKISFSSIQLNGIDLIAILLHKKIDINTVLLNDFIIQDYKNSAIKEKQKKEKIFNLDSIYLNKLDGLKINSLIFNNFQHESYDFSKKKMVFKSNPLSFTSSGLELNPLGNHYFKMTPTQNNFEIKDISLDFKDIDYTFSIDNITLDFKDKLVHINNLKFKPKLNTYKIANARKYCDPVYDIELKDLSIYNFQLPKLLKKEGLFIDSIQVSQLDLHLYKDRRKPFDESKRPGLPHTGLKRMKFPLYIQKLLIKNSTVLIETRLDDTAILMKVPISNLNAEITNITSVKTLRETPMKLSAQATLMQSSSAHLEAIFPLKDHQNTFHFSGSLGRSKMKVFDVALYPALGLKVLKGTLDELTFSASANETKSQGTMTMQYHNLEAKVFKSSLISKENKFLSWTVNSIIQKSNPKKNNPPREVNLGVDRVIYKGLGNYFWKTLQGGIINTIAGVNQTKASKERKHHRKKKE